VVVDVDLDGDLNVARRRCFVDGAQPEGAAAENVVMLSFQRLDVYQRAIEFLVVAIEVVEQVPRGHAERCDQLSRAAESVVRNIAEGAGRWSDADSAKHYKIARGEAMEAAASLDVLRVRQLVSQQHYDRGVSLLASVVAMLTKML